MKSEHRVSLHIILLLHYIDSNEGKVISSRKAIISFHFTKSHPAPWLHKNRVWCRPADQRSLNWKLTGDFGKVEQLRQWMPADVLTIWTAESWLSLSYPACAAAGLELSKCKPFPSQWTPQPALAHRLCKTHRTAYSIDNIHIWVILKYNFVNNVQVERPWSVIWVWLLTIDALWDESRPEVGQSQSSQVTQLL